MVNSFLCYRFQKYSDNQIECYVPFLYPSWLALIHLTWIWKHTLLIFTPCNTLQKMEISGEGVLILDNNSKDTPYVSVILDFGIW